MLPPGDLQKQWKILVLLHVPQKGCQHQYNINNINSQKPLKPCENERFHSAALRESLVGAKWVMAPPLDPTGGPFKNNGKSLCF